MTTRSALQVLSIAKLRLQTLSVEKVALAFSHLHNVNLFEESTLLIVQLFNLLISHRTNIFVELTVADRANLFLQLTPVNLIDWHFLLFRQLLLH